MVFRKVGTGVVNRARTALDGAAGKSINVAKVLKELGEHPFATGFLGGIRGDQILARLQPKEIESDFIRVSPETRECITVIDESTGSQTELVEESPPVSAQDYERLLELVRRRVGQCRAVIMSGTIAPGGPSDFYRLCTEIAHQVSALSVVDAQGEALVQALKARPGLVKPNRAELASTVGRQFDDEAALCQGMAELHERGAQRIVITSGQDPTLAFDGKKFSKVRSPSIKVMNAIGSGDAFTAGLVWRLLRGEELGEACRWATAAGAANALTLMPGELERRTVENLVSTINVEGLN
jgi:1-phosphofructokinase family hexose kinase